MSDGGANDSSAYRQALVDTLKKVASNNSKKAEYQRKITELDADNEKQYHFAVGFAKSLFTKDKIDMLQQESESKLGKSDIAPEHITQLLNDGIANEELISIIQLLLEREDSIKSFDKTLNDSKPKNKVNEFLATLYDKIKRDGGENG